MAVYDSVLSLIGDTPIVRLSQFDTGPCSLFIKLECQNPGGSIKDRPALGMVEAAEQAGLLVPGGTIVESTAGNTGLGLALVAQQKGYQLILVMPDKMSREKITHLQAMGARVVMTRSDVTKGHPDYYQDKAKALVEQTPGAVYINQFANDSNPLTHQRWTGPEIWQQMDHQLDALVLGVGTGGTLSGAGAYLKSVNPELELIIADPKGSILADYIKTGQMGQSSSWLVEGIGEDFIPHTCNPDLADDAITVTDKQSFLMARALLKKAGILAGSSTGTALQAALTYCQRQTQPKRVLTFACDSGNKYFSKMFNDYWMLDQGFLEKPHYDDLRDVIGRMHSEGETVIVRPDETLLTAYSRMKLYDVSQLPVMSVDNQIAGIIDESDLLLAVYHDQDRFNQSVQTAMTHKLEVVDAQQPLADLLPIFDKEYVAIVMAEQQFLGIITRIDLLNYLRRKLNYLEQ